MGSAHAAFLQSSPRPAKLLKWRGTPPYPSTLPHSAVSCVDSGSTGAVCLRSFPCLQGGHSLCHKPVKDELGWKAQVPSGKIKNGLWAQAVMTTPTVQIFILEHLCWKLPLEDRTSVLLQDPCLVINLVNTSGYPAYYTFILLICPLTIKINLSLH